MLTYATVITLILLFLPIDITFMGRDALTTGTVCIMLLFVIFAKSVAKSKTFFVDKSDILALMLALAALISTVSAIWFKTLDADLFGHAVRQGVSFISAIMLFTIIKNAHIVSCQGDVYELAEKFIGIILVMIAVHVLITILILAYPPSYGLFSIFYGTEHNVNEYTDLSRNRSFVFSPEQYGEILGALSPFLAYKILKDGRPIWYVVTVLFAIGLLLAATRSGIVLFILGIFLTFAYMGRINLPMLITSFLGFVSLLLATYLFQPSLINKSIERFEQANSAYSSNESIFEIVNRDNLPDFYNDTIDNLSFFGHSLARIDYHNLLLSSLHQLGIIGTVLFVLIFIVLIAKLTIRLADSKGNRKYFVFCCLLFLVLFLMNELKFEFTRTSSYQQICWSILGSIYLLTKGINPYRKAAE